MIKRLIFVLAMLVLLAGCSEPQEVSEVDFKPQNYSMKQYVVEHKDGYDMEVVKINHTKDYDLFEKWNKSRAREENQDRYRTVRESIDDAQEMVEEEEAELKRYCESLHSNSCLEMQWIRDKNGCRKVEITCEENDTEDICIEYDVAVQQELYEEDEC